MAYTITKSDGTIALVLEPGVVNTATASVALIGKDTLNYGQYQNNNFLHLVENFAAPTEPDNKLAGQLWYDTSSTRLMAYITDLWQPLAVMVYSNSSAAAAKTGNLWFDTVSEQLLVNTDGGFVAIGPESFPGYGTTRFVPTTLIDSLSVAHPVLKGIVDDVVVTIISKDSFDMTPGVEPGYTHIYQGISTANTLNFGTLTDSSGTSVTKIDTSVTLSANSNSRLATQRAVKTYVDNALSGFSSVPRYQ